MTREEKPNETPRKEKMQEALAHYDEIATKACWHRSDIPEAIRAYYASPSSATAEEYFLEALGISDFPKHKVILHWYDITKLMHEFATLHAQKIADKMVSERLREELIAFGKVVRSWGIVIPSDILECSIDEYLKSRER